MKTRKPRSQESNRRMAESLRKYYASIAIPVEQRFWPKVKRGNKEECWVWHKPFKTYYPLFNYKRVPTPAHRVAFELTHGKIQSGVYICHDCDNPACCNPNHLYAGTQKSNIADAIKRGRFKYLQRRWGVAVHNAKLTDAVVIEMRCLHNHGATLTDIANKFGVSRPTATRAIRGKTWAHVQAL